MIIFEFVEFFYIDIMEVMPVWIKEILLETLFVVLLVGVP